MMLVDLLFILLFLTTVGSLFTAGWFLFRHQPQRARRILLRVFFGAAVYFAIVIAVSLLLPRRVLKVGTPECFDDWCVAITAFQRQEGPAGVAYKVDLRLSSRARRAAQRERNLVVYLTDRRARRFGPTSTSLGGAFDVLLKPGEAVTVSRDFLLPPDANGVGAVVTHEGGFPIGWFIIGYDTWFRKPPILPLE